MANHRIVVVDDDPVMAKVMRVILDDDGFETVTVARAASAIAEVTNHLTHLVILDVNLPDMNGFALFKELRARRYLGPVIFLTGCHQLGDKLEGFALGADDYVVKPYEPLELIARVQCVLRRVYASDQQSLGTILRVDDAVLTINDLTYSSDVASDALLTPTEMRMLECLMRNSGIVISRETLIERIWGYEFDGDTNRVDVYIRRVRRKIEANPTQPRYLHTVRGIGYVFRPDALARVDMSNASTARTLPTSLAVLSA
jgi:two-component system, OmpR family, response regulator RegX3